MSTRSHHQGELDPGLAALASLAHGSLGQMTPQQRARGLEQLTRRMQRSRGGGLSRLVFVGGALAVAALALVILPRAGRLVGLGAKAPLAYRLEGAVLGPGGAILPQTAAAAMSPTLRFSDGSQVTLMAGARGRLTSVDHQGARFAIERGAAAVRITPGPAARWLFDVGPFLITVHGTVFTAGWDEAAGKLDVRLEQGLVTVTGPVAGGPIEVSGGHHLTVTLRQARVLLRTLAELDAREPAVEALPVVADAPAPARAEAPAEAPASAEARPAPVAHAAGGRASSGARAGHAAGSWVGALASGEFETIVREAEREGDRALSLRGTDDLAALADAARYGRHYGLAQQAMLAQRRRFPRSVRATDAAFLLGRLDEDSGRGLENAVKWYDRYLEEAPSGTYASEALGRKMVAVQKLHGTARARATAEEYARRFPYGVYSGAARALLDVR